MNWLMAAVVVVFVALVALVAVQNNKFDETCRAKGGVPHHMYKSDPICLKPSSTIDVGE